MDLLLLLYTLSFVPVKAGQYSYGIDRARDAAMIQTGAKSQFTDVKHKIGEKAKTTDLYKPVIAAAWLYEAKKNQEIKVKTQYGTFGVTNNGVTYGLSISF